MRHILGYSPGFSTMSFYAIISEGVISGIVFPAQQNVTVTLSWLLVDRGGMEKRFQSAWRTIFCAISFLE